MNSTNRFANRMMIVLAGLAAVAIGLGAIAWAAVPGVQQTWSDIALAVNARTSQWLSALAIPGTGTSWALPAALAILVVAVVVLVLFILRQGRGHTRTVLTDSSDAEGSIVIDAEVAESLLGSGLKNRPEFVASRVSAYSIRRAPALKVSVTCRRGVAPNEAVDIVRDRVLELDRALGRTIPVMVHIAGGFRSSVAHAARIG